MLHSYHKLFSMLEVKSQYDDFDSLIRIDVIRNRIETMQVVVLLVSFILISVIAYSIVYSILERKDEISILFAMGMSKWKILLSFVIELACFLFPVLLVGAAAAAIGFWDVMIRMDKQFAILAKEAGLLIRSNVPLLLMRGVLT